MEAVRFGPTQRAADTATPWASRGGWSGEIASPAVVVGRLRRAADAIVGRGGAAVPTHNTDPWLSATPQDAVAHQRDAQLTWWSILQGIAMGEFIMRFPEVWDKAWSAHHYYLLAFVFATFVLLIDVWIQMAWAIIILRWPLAVTHAVLTTLLGIVSVFMVTKMAQPFQWLISAEALAVAGIGIYAYNLKQGAYVNLGQGAYVGLKEGQYGWRPIWETAVYVVVIAFLIAWTSVAPSSTSYGIAGVVSVVSALLSLYNQSVRMKYERQKFLFHEER